MKYSSWLIVIIIAIMAPAKLASQSYSESKSYVHQFPVTSKTTVEISNKYGKVQLLTWDKDSARIDIDFYISSSSSSRLDKLRQNIGFDVSNSNTYIVVKTVFGKTQTNVIDEIRGLAETIVNGSNEIRIDYTVHIPKTQALKITNKYGDIYADDLFGDVQLNLSNGDLKANELKGNTQLFLSFGNAFINDMSKGRITSEYGDLNIRSSQDLSLESKSSKIRVENGDMVKLHSRRDDIRVDNANVVTGDGYFSDINIQNITGELNFTAKFGKVTIDNFRKSFSFVNVTSEYADLDLYFERGSSFDFDIAYYKDVLLRLPKEAVKEEEKVLNAETNQMAIYGKVGNNSGNSKVKLVAPKKCYLNLYLK